MVVDASAALDVLVDPADNPELALVLVGETDSLASPDLLDVECLHVLRRWERQGEIGARRARQALDDLQLLPISRFPSRTLTDRAWRLRQNLSAYDAQYVALAQELEASLITTDDRLAAAARTARVPVWRASQARGR